MYLKELIGIVTFQKKIVTGLGFDPGHIISRYWFAIN